jgi:hypothetical protein
MSLTTLHGGFGKASLEMNIVRRTSFARGTAAHVVQPRLAVVITKGILCRRMMVEDDDGDYVFEDDVDGEYGSDDESVGLDNDLADELEEHGATSEDN